MIGKNLEKARKLAEKYPEIFHDQVDVAITYLSMVENIKQLYKELEKINEKKGMMHTKTLLIFLETQIQFENKQNLFLTMDDVKDFAHVCTCSTNDTVKNLGERILKDSKEIVTHVVDSMFENFDYTNFEQLAARNLEIIKEKEKEPKPKKPTL